MTTTTIQVTTKKGATQTTTWGIAQNRPYPSIEGHCGSLRWANFGGVLPGYCQQPATGLGEEYTCDLLRSDRTEWDLRTRESNAGYVAYTSAGQRPAEPNPGSIVYRGVDLGEMSVEIRLHAASYDNVRVRGFDHATPGELAFIREQIIPALKEAIVAKRSELKAEAVAALKAHVAEKLAETRERLDAMQAEMTKAVDSL